MILEMQTSDDSTEAFGAMAAGTPTGGIVAPIVPQGPSSIRDVGRIIFTIDMEVRGAGPQGELMAIDGRYAKIRRNHPS